MRSRSGGVVPQVNRAMLASVVLLFRLVRKPVRMTLGDRRRRLLLRDPFVDAARLFGRLGLGDRKIPVKMGRWTIVISPGDEMRLVLCSFNRFTKRLFGQYEPVVTRLARDAVHPGSVVVDVGAHVGRYVALMSERAGDGGRVIAIEPEPRNLVSLRMCVSLNHLSNVIILPCACSDHNGEAILHRTESSFLHTLSESELESLPPHFRGGSSPRARITVPVRTLDSILDELDVKQVELVKIDVEGAERLVLKGAEQSLETGRIRSLLIEVHHWHVKPDEVASMLGDGYTVHTPSPGFLYALSNKEGPSP